MWQMKLQRLGNILRIAPQQAGSGSRSFASSSASRATQATPIPSSSNSSSPFSPDQGFQPNRFRSKAYNARSIPYHLHVKASRNNTIMTLTTPEGQAITRVTSGMCGFKKTGRSGYEAGHQSAIRMFNLIRENQLKWNVANLAVVFNGFGTGREAFYRALMTDAGMPVRNLVRKFVDATRIRVGGCRPKKRRML